MYPFKKGWMALFLVSLCLIVAGCSTQKESSPPASSPPPSGAAEQPAKPANPTPDSSPPSSKQEPSPSDANEVKPMGPVTAVRIIDPASGWIGGKGWIAKTEDTGKTWQLQYQGEQTVDQLFALNGQDAWVVFREDPGSSNGRRLLHTTDGGRHWSPVGRVPQGDFLHSQSMNEAFIANYYSSDGGKNWTELSIPEHTAGTPYFHDKDNGWAVTADQDSFAIQRTTDGGKTWKSVMSRKAFAPLNGAIIRSAGKDDAWVECIGDSGMTQTSYSLFHTSDGGKSWKVVIKNATAGGGPAPGFAMNDNSGPHNAGSRPGPLYVINSKAAFMGGACPACDQPNTIGWTTDGGKTWANSQAQYPGYAGALLAFADASHGWWICTEQGKSSVMYTTSDGGAHWKEVHEFKEGKS